MFLTELLRRASRFRDEERGVALAAVIGVMAVALLVMTLVTSSIVSGFGHTTATRAGIQSRAAALAGIADARAMVDARPTRCPGATYASPGSQTPKFSVEISYRKSVNAAEWTPGCPPTNAAQIRYVAKGTAVAGGVAGQTAANTTSVESVYGSKPITGSTTGTGAAIYSWGSTVSGASGMDGGVGLMCTLGCASKATIQVRHGNAVCSSLLNITALNITADWMVQDGSFTDSGCPTINGNVTVSGKLSMSSTSAITGNVTAGSLSLVDSSRITTDLQGRYGNAWIRGAASLQGGFLGLGRNIDGNLTAKSRSGTGGIGGQYTEIPAGPGASPYVTSTVPDWVDYEFTGQAGWPGFFIQTLTAATCNSAGVTAAVQALGNRKGVIDAQACTSGLPNTISLGVLQNDVALIVPNTINFNIGGISLTAGGNNLWIIQPDSDVTDGVPTCPAGGGLSLSGVSVSFPHIMIYTPCTYSEAGLLSVTTLTGQIYAGKASLNGLLRSMNYAPIGLPGVDLTSGTYTSSEPRALISTRDVQAGAGG